MKISGHRTRAVFDCYNIIDERDLMAAITKTTAYVHRVSTQARVLPLREGSAR